MTKTWTPHYKIVPGSSGSSLCPPGHPNHNWMLEGYETTRHRTPLSIGSIEGALADDFNGSEYVKDRVRQMFDAAEITCSELWLRSVYAHLRNCYLPEDSNRLTSNLIIHSITKIAQDRATTALRSAYADAQGADLTSEGRNADNYRRGVTPPYGRRRGYEVTVAPDATKVYVYALADDGSRYGALEILARHAEALDASDEFTSVKIQPAQNDGDLFVPERVVAVVADVPEPMDPERHSAVACVREYFPDHKPRLDLIANVKSPTGLCEKCGNKVQYEAKLDKLAIVSTRMDGTGMTHWSYNTKCTDGGDHVR